MGASRKTEVRSEHGLAITIRKPSDAVANQSVVFVHGAMDRAASFSRCMRRLSESASHNTRTLAYDRRGYAGSTDAGVAQTLDEHAQDLLDVANIHAVGPTYIIGHSLGGTIALIAATKPAPFTEPASVEPLSRPRLTAVGSYESPRPWVKGLDRGEGTDTLAVGAKQGPEAAAEYFYRQMVGDAVWERLRGPVRKQRLAEGDALMAELAATRTANAEPATALIKCPIFCAMGSKSADRMREATIDLAKEVGVTPTEIQGAGHGVHLSHPGLFADWATSMLKPSSNFSTGSHGSEYKWSS